ncbi:hypothetical protein GH714_007950 [Hevea brasiliensis]|uniref:Uncharacterized protein n=1 Tax=Hevea brasiliensis TaxID=3981 RepID=A0A6A6NBB3_HEVBR|nr:hypothetical protein GH714_007950 [Hevea brasiliensis]
MYCHGNSLHEETDFDITSIICSIIEDIGVDQVVQLITNNASISDSVREMLTKAQTLEPIDLERCSELPDYLDPIQGVKLDRPTDETMVDVPAEAAA